MGYGVTLSLFLFSLFLSPFKDLSIRIRHIAETIQCLSIHFLLKIQPWFNYKHNFQSILGFYKKYNTRNILFIPNHRSNLDTFILISLIPGLRGMAKSSLFYNIFFAPIMIVIGFVPVKKQNVASYLKGLQQLKNKFLKQNKSVLVFPETTRCEKKYPSVQKFSSSVFEVAISSKALIVPIYIKNSDEVLGRGDFLVHTFKVVHLTLFSAIDASQFTQAYELSDYVKNILLTEQLNQKKI